MSHKKNNFSAFSFILTVLILLAMPLGAEGITILKLNSRTELIINDAAGLSKDTGVKLVLSGEGSLKLISEENSAELRFAIGARPEPIFLYSSLVKSIPEKIIIEQTNADFDLVSAEIIAEKEDRLPIADIGHIIFSELSDSEAWNVYSWNLVPEVIIFDTRDYNVQSRLFKRLAFFVEKPGYVGTIVSNENLEGKHGWNAHDYKAEDLAEFFSLTENTGFELNDEELYLKELLLKQNIITPGTGGNTYEAGKGAVLSVSRQTEANWRYRFLTHECLHGIFFTNIQYESEIFAMFAQLEPEEVEFWKRLLDYRRYDVRNNYLLVNEFMAYSLQQPVIEVDEYFKGFLFRRMIAARPYEENFVADFNQNFPDSFTSSVSKLEKILYNYTGRIAGHLANIYPAEVGDSFFNLFPPI